MSCIFADDLYNQPQVVYLPVYSTPIFCVSGSELAMTQGKLFSYEMPSGWLGPEETWKVIGPYGNDLCNAVSDAYEQWPAWTSEEFRGRVQPQERGACITSLIFEAAKDRLAGPIATGDVVVCHDLHIRKLIFRNRVALRFKTAGPDLNVSRSRTSQDDAWYGNDPIEGFPYHLTRINMAVRSVPGADAVHDIHLTWQATPKGVGWSIQLAGGDMGTMPISAGPLPRITPSGGLSLPPIEITPLGGGKSRKGENAG